MFQTSSEAQNRHADILLRYNCAKSLKSNTTKETFERAKQETPEKVRKPSQSGTEAENLVWTKRDDVLLLTIMSQEMICLYLMSIVRSFRIAT